MLPSWGFNCCFVFYNSVGELLFLLQGFLQMFPLVQGRTPCMPQGQGLCASTPAFAYLPDSLLDSVLFYKMDWVVFLCPHQPARML